MSAGTTAPRVKAERCFALARSTEHAGERENAISRGKAICEREGLSLDDFDIPGRARPKPAPKAKATPRGYRDDFFRPNGAGYGYEFDREFADILRRQREEVNAAMREEQERIRRAAEQRAGERVWQDLHDALKRAAERTGQGAAETAYEASRRNFDEAAKAAKERDRVAALKARAKRAADELAVLGVYAYPNGDGWTVQHEDRIADATHEELIEFLRRIHATAQPFKHGVPRSCPGCGRAILYGDSCTSCRA